MKAGRLFYPVAADKKRKTTKSGVLEEKQEPWTLTDSVTNPSKEATLVQKMENCINKIDKSEFYHTFKDRIQTSVADYFNRVLGSELKMQMVIYGIGSIQLYESVGFYRFINIVKFIFFLFLELSI